MRQLAAVTILLVGLLFFGCSESDQQEDIDQIKISEIITHSSDYLNHRFFKLDLPQQEVPNGRVQGDKILLESIKIFQLLSGGEPTAGDIVDVAVYVDSLGLHAWDSIDFTEPHLFGRRWREITAWDPYLDAGGNLIAVDLRNQMADQDALAVIYKVELADGSIIQVGDIPGINDPQQTVNGGDGLYFRMKLLKASVSDVECWTFQYVLRNIYSLGEVNIDESAFDLRIEANDPTRTQAQQDEFGMDYIRIFGLDRDDPQRSGKPDGVVDSWDPLIIDLQKGLLKFPLDFPMPFAPGGNPTGREAEAEQEALDAYAANADTTVDGTSLAWINDDNGKDYFLKGNQTWQLYDPIIYPSEYYQYTSFRIIAMYSSVSKSNILGASDVLGVPKW